MIKAEQFAEEQAKLTDPNYRIDALARALGFTEFNGTDFVKAGTRKYAKAVKPLTVSAPKRRANLGRGVHLSAEDYAVLDNMEVGATVDITDLIRKTNSTPSKFYDRLYSRNHGARTGRRHRVHGTKREAYATRTA